MSRLLRFNAGPKMAEFAAIMDTTVEDVLQWANGQLNDPHPYYEQEYPTLDKRMEAIKGYIMWVIEYHRGSLDGINDRIRKEMSDVRAAKEADELSE